MKMITSALITLIAAAAFANEPTTAPAGTTTHEATTSSTTTTTPDPKMAKADAAMEAKCAKNPKAAGCDKWMQNKTKTK